MMILFVKLTKGIGHKFYQLMKSSPIIHRFKLHITIKAAALVQHLQISITIETHKSY